MKVTISGLHDELEVLSQRFESHLKEERVEKATLERIEQSLNQHAAKTNEMYEAFMPAKTGFAMIAGLGRAAKPIFWILALMAAVAAWWKTGNFQWPSL